MWSPLFSRSPDTAGCPQPLPGPEQDCHPHPPPHPGLSRGEEPADRGSLSIPAGPRSRSCQPIGGIGSVVLDQPSHVRVGGDVCPLVARGDPDSILRTLSSVLTVTPEHLQPTGLGGAWEDKAAFGCPRPAGQNASAPQPARETWKSALSPPLSVTAHILFLS